MAAVANTAARGHQPWALAAVSASRTRTTATRALVSTGFAGAPNAWAARGGPPRRAVRAARTKAGAAEVRPASPDAVTYRASISTNTPLHEPPGASFDEYLQDRARVFRAMFPDESRSQRIGDTEWELRGLDRDHAPSSFDLCVSGSLYADRSLRGRCRMRGHLEITITAVLPPPLRLVPESVLRGVAESVLSTLAEKMKRDVDVSLIADFQRFRREKAAAASRARPTLDATASAARDEAFES